MDWANVWTVWGPCDPGALLFRLVLNLHKRRERNMSEEKRLGAREMAQSLTCLRGKQAYVSVFKSPANTEKAGCNSVG